MHDRLTILTGDCRQLLKTLPEQSVQTVVTSPPYWNLRDYNHDSQIGMESTPEAYVEEMVYVFRELWRVLRDDGTAWLNLGDSYASGGRGGGMEGPAGDKQRSNRGALLGPKRTPEGLKQKDLCGIPWRVALALQTDGWTLRQDIIWHKPSTMPESVTDRCTKAHEYIFLLSKSPRYFFDNEAIKEPSDYPDDDRKGRSYDHHKSAPTEENNGVRPGNYLDGGRQGYPMRNKRSVWSVTNAGYREAHFATFPPDLIKPCILAGTSAKGCCPKCGSPWIRLTEQETSYEGGSGKAGRTSEEVNGSGKWAGKQYGENIKLGPVVTSRTTGWYPSCECGISETAPCTVLDPFGGSGTTGMVAMELGRKAILCELNPEYVELARQRCSVTPGLALA